MKKIFILLMAVSTLSCQSKKSKLPANSNSLQLIDVTEIYDEDLTKQARNKATEQNREEANKHFLEAMNLYRNKKQAGTSLGHFRMSLAIYPNAKVYYELGNALMDTRNYEEAASAYDMAARYEYSPYFKCAYNLACAHSRLLNRELALDYLRYALQEGYSNKEHLLKDEDLENIRNENLFRALIVEFFEDATDQRQVLFDLYLENFSKASLPFKVEEKAVNEFDYEKSISYDFAAFVHGMEDARFARDVVNEYVYGEMLAKLDSVIILTYKTHNSMSDTLGPNKTYLATYTKQGKLIDYKILAANISGSEFITGSIDENLVIRTDNFSRIWKENPLDKGYRDNFVVSTKPISTDYFHIDPLGKIVKGDVAIGPPQ